MTELHRTATVPYTPEQMFKVVNDIESYPVFLPWCASAKIIEKKENEVMATIEVSAAGVHKAFTTRNRLTPPGRMEMEHVDGPFKSLLGVWQFHDLQGQGCKVELEMEFEVHSNFMATLFGLFFSKAADKLVSAFCERAHALYGAEASDD